MGGPPHQRQEITLLAFSPREVQSRVRAGESAEQVSTETGWPLDKVLRYAEPLLAERAYIAEQAQSVEIRRTGGIVTLLESASAACDPDSLSWDAWRRADGKWTVVAHYAAKGRARTANWSYDHAGRNLHAMDDEARVLMGVVAVSDEAIVQALDLVAEPAPEPTRPRLVSVPTADEPTVDEPAADAAQGAAVTEIVELPEAVVEDTAPPVESAPAATKAPKRAKSRRGRASVPSWDEILFGATRPDDSAT
jgi:hypothetical protein